MAKTFLNFSILFISLLFSVEVFASSKLPSQFTLKKLRGKGVITAASLKNKPTVIEFWASWCTSCGESMERMYDWSRKNRDVRFLAVSVDNTIAEAKDFFKQAKSRKLKAVRRYAAFDNEATLATAINAPSLPATFVVDKNGNILLRDSGKITPAKIKKIEKALNKK